jgi:hypothetical protein
MVTSVTAGAAFDAFRFMGVDAVNVDLPSRESADQVAADIVGRLQPSVVVTGATGGMLTNAILRKSRRAGIPSVGILDHWQDLDLRFGSEDGREPFAHLQDRLVVMDEEVAAQLAGMGCPPHRIAICGHVYLDWLDHCARPDRAAARSAIGVEGERVILYVSEPVALDCGDRGSPRSPGYTEADVLNIVLEAFAASESGATLVVRPHPREADDLYMAPAVAARAIISRAADPLDLLMAADAVLGMTSMMLLQASLWGIPTASLQPDRVGADDFIGTKSGIVEAAHSRAAAKYAVEKAIRGELPAPRTEALAAFRRRESLDGEVANRVALLVMAAACDSYRRSQAANP